MTLSIITDLKPTDIAITVSLAAFVISLLNYRLSKTLGIRNQLYTEKFKMYERVTGNIYEFVAIIDRVSAAKKRGELTQQQFLYFANQVDTKALELDGLYARAHLIVPDFILTQLDDLMEYLIHEHEDRNFSEVFDVHEEKIRELSKELIFSFRMDLGIQKLNTRVN
ncbi:hypothetical protein ACTJKN_25805 [Pedobacter sp. 22163]|uniref:hypothetical protein n=1 Tax=Pedobacter sp. 22163 TaxID=3453883 RepID=UPI003F86A182